MWAREPLRFGDSVPLKAGLLTSLGFGHVSGLIALVHPQAFLEAVPAERRAEYIAKANERRIAGQRRLISAMVGGDSLYERPDDRRLGHDGTPAKASRELEANVLLNESARLGEDDVYSSGLPGAI